jgi:hypothetical protein
VSSECVRQFFAAVTSTAARRGLQRSHHPRVGFHKSGRNKRTGDGHVERRERITSVVSVTISGFPKGINSSPASLARSYKYHSNWSLSGHKKKHRFQNAPRDACSIQQDSRCRLCVFRSRGDSTPFPKRLHRYLILDREDTAPKSHPSRYGHSFRSIP